MKACLRTLLLVVFLAFAPASAKQESWYLNIGAGWSNLTYPSDVQTTLDFIKSQPGVDNLAIQFDLGVYGPINKVTAFGASVNASRDRYEWSGDWFQVIEYQYGFSALRYFGEEIGHGFFVRGDLGLVATFCQNPGGTLDNLHIGASILAGGGYSWRITPGTRLYLGGNYAYRRFKGRSTGAVKIGPGFQF